MTTDPPDTEDETTATRRAFLTGDWFGDETAGDGEEASAEGQTPSSTPYRAREGDAAARRPSTVRSWLGRVTGAGLLLFLVALLVLAPIPTAQAATGSANARAAADSASAALQARERALSLRAELASLDATAAVDADGTVRSAIDDRIEQGNISYRNGRYGQAIESYDLASRQARAALKRGYVDRARLLLDASQAHLAALNRQGYSTPRSQRLAVRAGHLDARLGNVSGVGEARRVERDAVALQDDVEALPPTALVRGVRTLLDGWYLVLAGGAFLCGLLLLAGAWLRPRVLAVLRPRIAGLEEPEADGDGQPSSTAIGTKAGHENGLDD
ncbi:MAG: hypothetical protein ABEJ23_02020 [Haloarculaceae archaeon]